MKHLPAAAVCFAIALLTFVQFPGHTWLQQDTQIYAPILERLADPSLLHNEILAAEPHVAYTLYDEGALSIHRATGFSFRRILEWGQIVARGFGIWGLYLLALTFIETGLLGADNAKTYSRWLALFAVSGCALGATIVGPSVLTVEYEPTPRAIALPLVISAIGLTARRRYVWAGVAGAVAFLFHPPTSVGFWAVFLIITLWRRTKVDAAGKNKPGALSWLPLAAAGLVMIFAARAQEGVGEAHTFFHKLSPALEQLQRMRASYLWISLQEGASPWRPAVIWHYLLVFAIAMIAFARVRRAAGPEARAFLIGLPAMGLISMPVSWLLLDQWHWALIPQFQPLRYVLFITLIMQFTAALAGLRAAYLGNPIESVIWFAFVYLPPLQPVFTEQFEPRRTLVALALALTSCAAVLLCRIRRDWRPVWLAAGLAAFFAIPGPGKIVNYTPVGSPELQQLSDWARSQSPKDAVFHFAAARKSTEPGIFRATALRAVYVDWKGGGQVNFFPEFAELWNFRWQQTRENRFKPADLPKFRGLGITYVVLPASTRIPKGPPVFQNATYAVYAL